jgi:hypothetical protein
MHSRAPLPVLGGPAAGVNLGGIVMASGAESRSRSSMFEATAE